MTYGHERFVNTLFGVQLESNLDATILRAGATVRRSASRLIQARANEHDQEDSKTAYSGQPRGDREKGEHGWANSPRVRTG
jgi:hypothetical protein